MAGDFANAKHAAVEVAAHAAPMLQDMPMAETHATYPIFMLLRFHRWDDVLALPAPSPGMAMTNAFWRFASGFAFAAKGQIATAEAERQILATARKETPADVECGRSNWGNA